jgi:hypothetical protein
MQLARLTFVHVFTFTLIYKNRERWQMVIAGITDGYNKKFGVVSYVIVGGSGGVLPQKHFIFFHP